MDQTTDPYDPAVEQILDDLRVLDAEAAAAERTAAAIAALATRLEHDADELSGQLRPVRALHHDDTWQGAAASRSRRRLEAADDTARRLVDSIDHLAASLRDEAVRRREHADTVRSARAILEGTHHQLLGSLPPPT